MLIMTDLLDTIILLQLNKMLARQLASKKLANLDRDLCVQLVLLVSCLAIHHLHFACACSVFVSPRIFFC